MLLVGQIADMFDDSTWAVILLFGFGSPAVGCLLGSIKRSEWLFRLKYATVYYAVLGLVFAAEAFMRRESVITLIAFGLLLVTGPIIGLELLTRPNDSSER